MRNYRIKIIKDIVIIIMFLIILFSPVITANNDINLDQTKSKINEKNIKLTVKEYNLDDGKITQNNNETAWEIQHSYSLAAEGIVTDSQNNIITIGPGGEAVIELPYALVVKYNPDGEIIWEDYRDYSLFNGLTNLLLNIYSSKKTLISKTTNSIFKSPKTSKELIIKNNNEIDYLNINNNHNILKMDSNETSFLINRWVRFYDVTVDSNDNIIVVGEIQHRNTQECRDVYIIKYDPDGKVLWDRIFKRYWLFSKDFSTGVITDSNDDIFVSISSKNKETDEYNGWVLKISSINGHKLKESFYQDKPTMFYDISKDTDDNIFVVGYFSNSGQMKVLKFSNNLDLLEQWGVSVMLFEPWALDVDPDNNVVVVGSVGFPENKKQYIVKFNPFGDILWSNKSLDYGILFDVSALSNDITVVTGIGLGDLKYRFYVGLYDRNGCKYKQYLGGNFTLMQGFISTCLDVDKNQDIVVGGFRNYGYYQYYMYLIKFKNNPYF